MAVFDCDYWHVGSQTATVLSLYQRIKPRTEFPLDCNGMRLAVQSRNMRDTAEKTEWTGKTVTIKKCLHFLDFVV